MKHLFPLFLGVGLILCRSALAQAPPAQLRLTLPEAIERARANSQQFLAANIAAQIAHEDTVQARASLLPSLAWEHGYIYTQPNGTDTGVFVPNNGVNVFQNMAAVHSDIFSPARRAEYQMSIAAEAAARARTEIAGRGLVATVIEFYYSMAVAERRFANAQRSLTEAQQFLDIAGKQERGGEVAHSDVVKAQIQFRQRQRDLQEAQLAFDKARIGFSVLLFPSFRQDFTVVDDLDKPLTLPFLDEVESLAGKNNPDIRAALAAVRQETFGVKAAKGALLPSLSVDYFFGINANQYALYNRFDQRNLGSSVQAQMSIPVWNWGALRSRVKQAELRLQQSRTELSLAQRQLLANLNSFYAEAKTATSETASLKQSLDLSEESLRLTLLRYQAGEVSVLEVVDAQTTVVGARNAYDDGLVRSRLAFGNLQTLTGSF